MMILCFGLNGIRDMEWNTEHIEQLEIGMEWIDRIK